MKDNAINFFNSLIYTEETIINKKVINKQEFLHRLTTIDLNKIFIPANFFTTLWDEMLSSKEFYKNYNNSVIVNFLKYSQEMGINLVYNGYHLKSLLLNIVIPFCKKTLPFLLVANLKMMSANKNGWNSNGYKMFIHELKHRINIFELKNIYLYLTNIFIKYKDNIEIYTPYLLFTHYLEIYLRPSDLSFVKDINKEHIKLNFNESKINEYISLNIDSLKNILVILNETYKFYIDKNRSNNEVIKEYMKNLTPYIYDKKNNVFLTIDQFKEINKRQKNMEISKFNEEIQKKAKEIDELCSSKNSDLFQEQEIQEQKESKIKYLYKKYITKDYVIEPKSKYDKKYSKKDEYEEPVQYEKLVRPKEKVSFDYSEEEKIILGIIPKTYDFSFDERYYQNVIESNENIVLENNDLNQDSNYFDENGNYHITYFDENGYAKYGYYDRENNYYELVNYDENNEPIYQLIKQQKK